MRIHVPIALIALARILSVAACEGPAVRTVADIQGAGHQSTYDGTAVRTSGIVTAVDTAGFWFQDPVGDDEAATSEGLFVSTRGATAVNIGDEVSVTGTVAELRSESRPDDLTVTALTGAMVEVRSTGNALPAAIVIARDRIPPSTIVDDDGLARFEPDTDGIDFYESLEGMRVTVPEAIATGPISRFGEVFVLANGGAGTSGSNAAGGITLTANAGVDFNPERIKVAAGFSATPDFMVNEGDSLGNVTGVLGYGFGNYEVRPDVPIRATRGNTAPESSALPSGGSVLSIATYNVENLDPDDEDGDRDVADGKFDRLARQIAENLGAPDIVGLQEIQDDDGSLESGLVTAAETLARLTAGVNAVLGADVYRYIDNTFIGNGTSGGQPGGNIRVAYLYRSDRVSAVPGSERSVADAEEQRTNPEHPFFGGRLPLAVDFLFNGARVTVVNNHFASKGGGTPVFGAVQPFVNGNAEVRTQQAAAINTFVDDLLSADPGAHVIVLGDLNEFWFDPIIGEHLTGAREGTVLHNLWLQLPETERYSYIYEGNSQTLDHILVTENLRARLVGFDAVHVNSPFADQASDHDPLLAAFDFGAIRTDVPRR